MITIDSLNLKRISAIKVDVEGFEENVLRGARETIIEFKPSVMVEQKRDFAKRFDLRVLGAIEYLTDLGYRVAKEMSGDYILTAA